MQQRINELHDKMEESGLHGAVNLLEQLFDKKPGEDVPNKKKLKDKVWAGITKSKVKSSKRGKPGTGQERLIRSHLSARFSFELSGNSN